MGGHVEVEADVAEAASPVGAAAGRGAMIGLLLIGVALLVLCEWLATREYFKLDDFYYLAQVRRSDWNLLQAFFPSVAGRYWAVRPLGEPAYFFVSNRLFGMHAFAWWQTTIAVHFATGLVVVGIARRIGCDVFAAAAAGAFAIAMPPALLVMWWGVGFAYLASILLGALAVMFFLETLLGARWIALVFSCLAFLASLLCHEAAVGLPLVLAAFAIFLGPESHGSVGSPGLRGVRRTLSVVPAACIAIAYLAYRHALTGTVEGRNGYGFDFSPIHLARSYWAQAELLVGGRASAVALVSLLVALLVWLLRSGSIGAAGRRWLGRRAIMCLLWAGLALGPMVLLPISHIRFSTHAAVPVALLLGCFVHVTMRGLAGRRTRAAQAVVLVLVGALAPWSMLAGRIRNHRFDFVPAAAGFFEGERGSIEDGSRIVLLMGWSPRPDGPRLAGPTAYRFFGRATYGGRGLIAAVLADRRVDYQVQDLGETPALRSICSECRYFLLTEDLAVSAASPEIVVENVLLPALASDRVQLYPAVALALLDRNRLGDLPRLVEACSRSGPGAAVRRCAARVEKALRARRTPKAIVFAERFAALAARGSPGADP